MAKQATSNFNKETKVMELSFGDKYKKDFDELLSTERGKKNVFVLCQTQIRHKMSNEVDSVVNAYIREQLDLPASNPKGMPQAEKDAIRQSITDWRESNKMEVDEQLTIARDDMWDVIVNGEIGLRIGGPRKDPVLAEFESLLVKEARKVFREQNYETPDGEKAKFPTDNETTVSFLVKGADGIINTLVRTRPELIANYKLRHEARLMDKAREVVALREAQAPAPEPAQADVGF